WPETGAGDILVARRHGHDRGHDGGVRIVDPADTLAPSAAGTRCAEGENPVQAGYSDSAAGLGIRRRKTMSSVTVSGVQVQNPLAMIEFGPNADLLAIARNMALVFVFQYAGLLLPALLIGWWHRRRHLRTERRAIGPLPR